MIAIIHPSFVESLPHRDRRKIWRFSLDESAAPSALCLVEHERKQRLGLAAVSLASGLLEASEAQGGGDIWVSEIACRHYLETAHGIESTKGQISSLLRIIGQLRGVTAVPLGRPGGGKK